MQRTRISNIERVNKAQKKANRTEKKQPLSSILCGELKKCSAESIAKYVLHVRCAYLFWFTYIITFIHLEIKAKSRRAGEREQKIAQSVRRICITVHTLAAVAAAAGGGVRRGRIRVCVYQRKYLAHQIQLSKSAVHKHIKLVAANWYTICARRDWLRAVVGMCRLPNRIASGKYCVFFVRNAVSRFQRKWPMAWARHFRVWVNSQFTFSACTCIDEWAGEFGLRTSENVCLRCDRFHSNRKELLNCCHRSAIWTSHIPCAYESNWSIGHGE